MTCDGCLEVAPLLPLWLDGELADNDIEMVREHVRGCRECSHELQRLRRLKGALLRASRPQAMPAELRMKLERSTGKSTTSPWVERTGIALAAMLAWAVLSPTGPEIETDAASMAKWHASNVPLDISTPDLDTVRRYLSEKVSFAVRPPAFRSKESLSLIGGRVTNLGQRRGALLKFKSSSGDSVSVFVSPVRKSSFWERLPALRRPEPRSLELSTQGGFSVARWSDGVLNYSAVSDTSVKDLARMLTAESSM